jgi:hypothetical protein
MSTLVLMPMWSQTLPTVNPNCRLPLPCPTYSLLSQMWDLPLDEDDTCLASILEVSTLLHDPGIRSPQVPACRAKCPSHKGPSLGAHHSVPALLVALPPQPLPAPRVRLSSGTVPLHEPLRVFHTRQTHGYPYPYPSETRTPVKGHGFRRVRVRVPLMLPGGYP